jgi:hypothetical protein
MNGRDQDDDDGHSSRQPTSTSSVARMAHAEPMM